jgi:uncharacterized membrane protein YgcG
LAMRHSVKCQRLISKRVDAMRRFFTALIVLFCLVHPALAEEVIRNFVSDVTVNADGSLEVSETIVVRAEGQEIKRGILRDFPTTYKDKNDVQVRVGFEVLNVQRSGYDEKFVVENISNGKRIKIGSADVFLNRGDHTYKITYRTTRQIGFFRDFDELYWNVTGNGWTFPIDKAFVIVRLPNGATAGQHAVYTGAQGQNGGDAKVTVATGNRFEAQTTQRLSPSEGFTIAVSWPKGFVAPPTEAEKQRDWIRDNLGYFGLGLTLLLVPLYYFFAWLRVGRDPHKGTIVPLFRPPEGMGPAGVRYVYNAGYDDKAFAAGLVGLAVKGRMSIRNDGDDYSITKRQNAGPALTRSEAALFSATPNSALTLQQSNHSSVIAMRSALEGALDDEYDGVMYLKNFKWFLLGLVFSAIGLIGSALLLPSESAGLMLGIGGFTTVWWGVILAAGYSVVKGIFQSSGWLSKIRSLMGLIFLVPFVGAGVAVPAFAYLTEFGSNMNMWFLIAAMGVVACNLVFYWLLKAPTPRGRAVLNEIEGFHMYMTTAEEERLKVLHPPEKTPELFERYLPYAMALDCENEWNDKFAAVLAAAAAAGATAGAVGVWYHGPGGFNSRSFGQDLGSSLTSSISSSGTAPGSSSGSSGGGFSGGGGGGGGGSGW